MCANDKRANLVEQAAGTPYPIINPIQRGIAQQLRADSIRTEMQQVTNIHE